MSNFRYYLKGTSKKYDELLVYPGKIMIINESVENEYKVDVEKSNGCVALTDEIHVVHI